MNPFIRNESRLITLASERRHDAFVNDERACLRRSEWENFYQRPQAERPANAVALFTNRKSLSDRDKRN